MNMGFSFGAKPQNNAFSGFNNNNTSNPFGQGGNTTPGFGNQSTGYGTTNNNTGFATGGNTGFGATSNTGFGQNNTGFGTTNNTGFAGNNTGFGTSNNGFGITNNTGNTGGFGVGNNGGNGGSGVGTNSFGNTGNNNQTFVQTEDYKKDIKMNDSIVLQDSISAIKWLNPMGNETPPIFAGTCWDRSVRIFEVAQNNTSCCINQKSMINLPQPATCLAWNQDNTIIYAGCINGAIRAIDVNTMNISQVGKHNAGISSISYIPGQNVIISTGYEDKIHFWQGQPNPVMSVSVDNKVFVADYSNGILAGATANQKIFYIDINMISNKTISDSVDLGKFSQIQSLSLDKKGETIGLTTVDGRCNISSLTRSSNGFKSHAIITFKSNKTEEKGSVILYPTNTSSFNPFLDGWFLTGGSDGTMSYWDYKARNKIKSFGFNAPVCNASVSSQGNMVAYSLGNDWHIGAQGIGKWPNLLGVHLITDQEKKFNGNKR